MNDWKCPHGLGAPMLRGDCLQCNADIKARPAPETITGDERAAEVDALLNGRHAYRFDDVHERLEALVGRPVWTHEFATDTRLIEEARGAFPHPANLAQHAIDSARAVVGDKPVVVIEIDK